MTTAVCPTGYLLDTWRMLDRDERGDLFAAWVLYDHEVVLELIERAAVRRAAILAWAVR